MPTETLISVEEYIATSYRPDCDYMDGRIEERNAIGLCEVKTGVLKAENPELEIPLAELFE